MPIDPKSKLVRMYIDYKKVRNAYARQNFWLIIASVSTLISITLMTICPFTLWYMIFHISTLVSYVNVVRCFIANKGVIWCSQFQKCRYKFYHEIDELISGLCEKEEEKNDIKDS